MMTLLYAYISLIVNLCLAIYFVNEQSYEYILYAVAGNYLLSICLCTICIYYTILLVNSIQYAKYNYPKLHSILARMLLIFTLNTAEIKFLLLSILIGIPIVYEYGVVAVAFFYNVNFMSMFFYELTNEYKNTYNTIAVYQNTMYMFFLNSQHLYFKHMFNRAALMFFMIAGDNWILDDISDGDDIYDKLGYMGIFNSLATILYIIFGYYVFK